MQMHDALRQVQGGSAIDALAMSCNVLPTQVQAAMQVVAPALAWALESRSLNRDGLADLVEAVGRVERAISSNALQGEAARAEGEALLSLLLVGAETRAMLVADVAKRTGLSDEVIESMLPGLAVLILSTLAGRAKGTLGALLVRMPSLGRWSKGSPHADLADVLRRRCGGGPYGRGKLRRLVRHRIGRAGGFGSLGVIGWYLRFMLLRPAAKMARPILSRVMPHEV